MILRLDKSTSSLRLQFLFGADADAVDLDRTSLVDIADMIRKA